MSACSLPPGQTEERRWLTAVLAAAETDPWRRQVRRRWRLRTGQADTKLIADVEVARQPVAFLLLLARQLPGDLDSVRLQFVGGWVQQAYPDN